MNPPLGIMLRFLEYISDEGMVRNVMIVHAVVLLAVYDLSAERGVYRLYEMKGRNWSRHVSVFVNEKRLQAYNHKAWSLVVDTSPHSSDMIVIHSTQVPDVMVVDMVQRRWAMVVHYFPFHLQRDPIVMASKVMELVESVGQGGCISSTDLRLTSLNLALRP